MNGFLEEKQPLTNTSVLQGDGTVLFKWKSPLNGTNGPVAKIPETKVCAIKVEKISK